MASGNKYDVFLSYRRDGGIKDAMLLQNSLEQRGYHVFLDIDSMDAGQFDEQLYQRIDECTDFVLILPPDALDRCEDEKDWVRLEIQRAHEGKKNIVPVMLDGFSFPDALPQSIDFIRYTHGIRPSMDFFDAFIDKLTSLLKSKPTTLPPPPPRPKWLFAVLGILTVAVIAYWFIHTYPSKPVVTPAPAISAPASEMSESPVAEPVFIPGESNVLAVDEHITEGDLDTEGSYSVFRFENLTRKDIATITFLDSLSDAPTDAVDCSENGDGSVLGWIKKSTGGLYDLYIGGEKGVSAPADCRGLFNSYVNLRRINFGNAFHTDGATDFLQMFFYCPKLSKLDLKDFNTKNVKDMSGMFCHNGSLEIITFGEDFDTSNVTAMTSMFYGCKNLQSIEGLHFNTENVTSMYAMFLNCGELEKLDVSSFVTSDDKLVHLGNMFKGCSKLEELNLSGFHTKNVQFMYSMFYDCAALKNIIFSDGFDTSHVTNMTKMFAGCTNLSSETVDAVLKTFKVSGETQHDDFMPDSLNPNWRDMFKVQ